MVTDLNEKPMPTAVVILASTTYRATEFIKAAEGLGIDLVVASDVPPPFDMGDRYLQIDCTDPNAAAEAIVALGDTVPIDGVLAADDSGVVVAAMASKKLGLRGNLPEAAAATRNKASQRRLLTAAELSQPKFALVPPRTEPRNLETELRFPIVLKPLDRTAGQGVIRVDQPDELSGRLAEVRRIVGTSATLLAEEFVDGIEVALEGIVANGNLRTLTIFDKPAASRGPAFPETILVSPTTMSAGQQEEVTRSASAALRALGIEHGPVHVEMIVHGERVTVIEVAARSIGGLCSHALSFGLTGTTLEALILRNALGLDKPELRRERAASGVLMIPIPGSGVFQGVDNLDDIREIDRVTGIEISIRPGTKVEPPPIGDRYLGFVFAKGPSVGSVTAALVKARDLVKVTIS